MIQDWILTANLARDFCYAYNFVQLFAGSWQIVVYSSKQPMNDRRLQQHGCISPSESCSFFSRSHIGYDQNLTSGDMM